MEKVFLDTNIIIDLIEERKNVILEQFGDNKLFISPLSLHILAYAYNYHMPSNKLLEWGRFVTIVPLGLDITKKSLVGPTEDFEDNVQLHSAVKADCDIFLTADKKLLNLKFFGKMRLLQEISTT